jgi:hypothetical protein
MTHFCNIIKQMATFTRVLLSALKIIILILSLVYNVSLSLCCGIKRKIVQCCYIRHGLTGLHCLMLKDGFAENRYILRKTKINLWEDNKEFIIKLFKDNGKDIVSSRPLTSTSISSSTSSATSSPLQTISPVDTLKQMKENDSDDSDDETTETPIDDKKDSGSQTPYKDENETNFNVLEILFVHNYKKYIYPIRIREENIQHVSKVVDHILNKDVLWFNDLDIADSDITINGEEISGKSVDSFLKMYSPLFDYNGASSEKSTQILELLNTAEYLELGDESKVEKLTILLNNGNNLKY